MIDFTKPLVDPNVVALLEHTLTEAKAGRVLGLAMVCVQAPGKPGVHIAGTGFMEMNLGCDVVKQNLVAQVLKPSALMRVG